MLPKYTTRYEELADYSYVGKATPGSLDSSAVWQIVKMDTSSTVLKVLYPSGIDTFNSIWDNRASYTYS